MFWLLIEFLLLSPGIAMLCGLLSVSVLPEAGASHIDDATKVDYVARFTPILPFVAMLADTLENISAAVAVLFFPEPATEYVRFHGTCAQIKWLSLVLWVSLHVGVELRTTLRPALESLTGARSKKSPSTRGDTTRRTPKKSSKAE